MTLAVSFGGPNWVIVQTDDVLFSWVRYLFNNDGEVRPEVDIASAIIGPACCR